MRKTVCSIAALLLFWTMVSPAMAGRYYLTDHDEYWQFVRTEPAYALWVPASAERYAQKQFFGHQVLEMHWNSGNVVFQVGSFSGSGIDAIRTAVTGLVDPGLREQELLADRDITTSAGETAAFYAFSGQVDGTDYMLRSVYFERGDHVVYLVLMLEASAYDETMRQYWVRAVNTFSWR